MGIENDEVNQEEPYFNNYISFHRLDEEEKIRLLTRFQVDLVEYYKYKCILDEKNKLIIKLNNKLLKIRRQLAEYIEKEQSDDE